MFRTLSRAILFVCFIIAALGASADQFDREVASIILLQSKKVQAELGVTAAERAAMNKFADAHRAKLTVYYKQLEKEQSQGKKPSLSESKLVGLFQQLKDGVLAQLTDAQVRRLREISLQALDFTALADKSVAARVGIPAAQASKIETIISSGIAKANQIRNSAISQATATLRNEQPKTEADKEKLYREAERRGEAARQRVNPQLEQIRTRTKQQVMNSLTPAEKAKWQALLGKPFYLDR